MARIDRVKFGREIRDEISRDKGVQESVKRIAEEVQALVKAEAPKPGPDHPYATGEFVESIRVRQSRGAGGRFISNYEVYSDDPIANFIEYGTGPDKPGSRSPWGPLTPTPEFAPFARAVHIYNATHP